MASRTEYTYDTLRLSSLRNAKLIFPGVDPRYVKMVYLAFISGGPIGRSQTDKNCTASPPSPIIAIYCQLYAQVRKNPEQVTVEPGRRSRLS